MDAGEAIDRYQVFELVILATHRYHRRGEQSRIRFDLFLITPL
jgi:hypothetical protein